MADNSRRLAGLASLKIDGVTYPVVSEPKWAVATRKRTTLTGMDKVHGYSEEVVAPFIAVTLRDEANTKIKGFQEMTNVSVTLELASGKRVSGTGLWTVETAEVDSSEATFAVRFEGEDIEES